MTPLEMRLARLHLKQLAKRHSIQLVWVRSWGKAEGNYASRVALIPRIECGRDYLVGLHELGHCLSLCARRLNEREDAGGQMAREAWAWGWAAEQCLPELAAALTAKDWMLVGAAFGSYIKWHAHEPVPGATLSASAGIAPAAPSLET